MKWWLGLILTLVIVARPLADARATDEPADAEVHRFVLPGLACQGCEEPASPQAPVNLRVHAKLCGADVECQHGGDVHVTATYLWPGGDETTGLVPQGPEMNAQTCIRVWAEPTELMQVPEPAYAFGGDCSTNTSGTTAEFKFTGPGPVVLCTQVDAFQGSRAIGSSNLVCLELTPGEPIPPPPWAY